MLIINYNKVQSYDNKRGNETNILSILLNRD